MKNKREAIRSKHIISKPDETKGGRRKGAWCGEGKGEAVEATIPLNMILVFSIHTPRYMGIYNCTGK